MSIDRLIPAEEALNIVLDDISPTQTETVTLYNASGRVLAKDLTSKRTQPPFDASAMDGYAVRQSDIATLPAVLKIIGESRAGVPFEGNIQSGEAVRIFTGAVVPSGADSIVIQENTESSEPETIRILSGVPEGKFIRKAGLDFKQGETLLRIGEELTPSRLALAASMNYAEIPVYKKPKVALLSTGDELVLPGKSLADGQIIASNTFGLIASVQNCGGEVLDFGIVEDTKDTLHETFEKALEARCDLIVTTGGASVGDHDLVMPVAREMGFEFEIAKIAMRPGKPFLFAKLRDEDHSVCLTGLAGNPVSSLVAFNVFVRPLIQIMAGGTAETASMRKAILGRNLPENDERAEYMRATLETGPDGQLVATPFDTQDSSMLANLVRADCLVYRAVKAAAVSKGEPVEIVIIAGSGVT
ncbi:MAG: molybdopterin molybdotransferase MoeA [Rhizobiaceae bacterium]|nr:molybdopterin molybdotransferase MoeA [Rhizobiaceae bacterium]